MGSARTSMAVFESTWRSEVGLAWARALAEGAQEAVIAMTPAGVIIGWNHAAELLYGYSASEAVGRSITMVVPPSRFNELEMLQRSIKFGVPIEAFETIRLAKGGTEIAVSLSVTPVHDTNGTVVGLLGFSYDIGAQKQAREQLAATRVALNRNVVNGAAELSVANATLQRQMRERHRLTSRLLQLQDEERRRLGRELHDSAAQNLAAMTMDLACLERVRNQLEPSARRALDDCVTLVHQCVRDLRTISFLLHPPLLEKEGLGAAARAYADGFAQRTGTRVEVEVAPNLGRLGGEIEQALFRVLQESLTNIYRHADSPTVTIRLHEHHGVATLTVCDAGRGINPSLLRAVEHTNGEVGVGIMGMRERLQQLGGQLSIKSGRWGTMVRASAPLPGVRSNAHRAQRSN